MENLLNKEDTPSEELEIFHPPAWPRQRCDSRGRCQSYKRRGRWANHWQDGRPHHATFLWRFYTGKDYSQVPSCEELDSCLPVHHPQWNGNGQHTLSSGQNVTSSDQQIASSGQQTTSSDQQITSSDQQTTSSNQQIATSGQQFSSSGQQIISSGSQSGSSMTWLGHATVLARVDGVNLLLDPVFSSRASAVQWLGPARYRDAACRVHQLPHVAAVLISHNHYDHLDLNSVKEILAIQPWVEWFLPAGVSAWMEENTPVSKSKLHDMEWWEELDLGQTGIKIAFTPSNHWSKRTPTDDYKTLWGSFAVLGPKTKFWFGGDTAYCEAFKQIGEQYGPFHMAAIPIGAYQPNWILKYNHVHPREAIQIHKDLRCGRSMAIHWGTFKLTVEHFLEPKQLLLDSLEKDGVGKEEFLVPHIGETVVGAVEAKEDDDIEREKTSPTSRTISPESFSKQTNTDISNSKL